MSKTDTQVTSLDDDNDAAAAAAAAPSAKAKAPAAAKKGEAEDPNRIVSLTIHRGQGDGGNDAVFVSVNEYARLIPRGLPVDVPHTVVAVLDMANQEVFTTEGKVTSSQSVPRYAYTVRG